MHYGIIELFYYYYNYYYYICVVRPLLYFILFCTKNGIIELLFML